jgi:hypothetical protein
MERAWMPLRRANALPSGQWHCTEAGWLAETRSRWANVSKPPFWVYRRHICTDLDWMQAGILPDGPLAVPARTLGFSQRQECSIT